MVPLMTIPINGKWVLGLNVINNNDVFFTPPWDNTRNASAQGPCRPRAKTPKDKLACLPSTRRKQR
eukprot:12917514-Prorocentrum_lima.AAC.1